MGAMKKFLRVLGIILIFCGVALYFIAGLAQKQMKPNEVKVGYMSNGEFVQTNSGYMGGNVEGEKDMGFLKGIGIVAGVGGVIALGVSFVLSDDQYSYYN